MSVVGQRWLVPRDARDRAGPYNPRMIPLFLGLHAANLLLLGLVFGMGLMVIDPASQRPTWLYHYHLAGGIAAGLMVALAHVSVYTYFMATSKWLQAASEKCGLDAARHVAPALGRKRVALWTAMAAIAVTMLTMFAGAGADRTIRPLWPAEAHLLLGALAIAVNVVCSIAEYRLIKRQGALMDETLEVVNRQTPADAAAVSR